MITFTSKHPQFRQEMLGILPTFLDLNDPRSAKEQFDEKYISGWDKFDGFKMLPDGDLKYPGDPPTKLLAQASFRDEVIRFYEHSWVVVMQLDGSWEVSRMD